MQVYIYICWQLKLSGNANLRLYQYWFAFTHRSPIKNFASCRLREKNFASLRLRKNLVELRARLSLLVDKTTFQYSVLTIYYTTMGGNASPSPRSQRQRAAGEGTPRTRRITTTSASRGGMGRHGRAGSHHHQRPRRRGSDALDAPGSAHRHPRRGGRGKVGDAVPDPPQRQHAAEEGTLQTCRDRHHQHPQPWRKWTPWMRRDHPPAPARRAGRGRHGRDGITTTSAASRDGREGP